MSFLMSFFRDLFGRSNAPVVCFTVKNYEAVQATNPDAITILEQRLAAAGALPNRIDFPSKQCCVTLTAPDISANDVQIILEDSGYEVTLLEKKQKD